MPTYEIAIPNGKKFQVTANSPEEASSSLDEFLKQPQPGETPQQTEERVYGKAPSQPSTWHSALAGAFDTLTGGFGDEASAGVESVLGGRSYDDALKFNRAANQELSEANPKSYLGGQVAGAVVPAIATGGTSTGATLGGRALVGSGIGAAQGGVYGFGSGEDGFQNRAINAGVNGAVGAIAGAAAPVVGQAIGAGWRGIANYLNGRGLPQQAISKVLSMLEGAGITPQQAEQRLTELGPDAFLADVNAGMQASTAATGVADAGAASTITSRLANRRGAAPGRVDSALTDAFGPAKDPYAVQQANKLAKGNIAPEYQTAIQNAPKLPESLQNTLAVQLTDPAVGMSKANRELMGNLMGELDDALRADNAADTASRLLDMRKRLDSMIVYDSRGYANLSPADRASQGLYKQVREAVDDILKNRIPGIREADAKHSNISQNQSAFDFGRKKFLQDGPDALTPSELKDVSRRYNPTANKAMDQGVRTEIGRRVGNANKNPAAATERLFDRNYNRQNIESRIGKTKSDRLAKALDREATFTETSNLAETTRGSRTAPIGELAKSLWNAKGNSGITGDMIAAGGTAGAFGGPSAGAMAAGAVGVRGAIQKLASALSKPNPKLIQETADRLTLSGPARDKFVTALQDVAASKLSVAQKADRISRLVQSLLGSQTPVVAGATRSLIPIGAEDTR